MSDIEWSQLRGALIFILIVSVVGGGLWFWSADFETKMGILKQRNNEAFQISAEQKHETEQAIQTLSEDYEEYVQLTRRGFLVADGQELEWFDYLDAVQRSPKLPRFQEFEITSVSSFALPGINTGEGFQILRSTITFDFELLHTGDLFALLDELTRQRLPGIFQIRGCEVKRLDEASANSAEQSNLTGTCELQWYRVRISNP
ncbi:MAG: hypothetical protein AAF512_13405 [Pseudomonadota bacterium]